MPRWLLLIGALAGCSSSTRPVGFAETAVALDDGGAIVLWRDAGQGQDRVIRVDAAGKRVWDRPLDGIPQRLLATEGVIVAAEVVAVRHVHVDRYGEGHQAIAAFALADGAPRWDTELVGYHEARGADGTPMPPTYLDAMIVGTRLIAWAGDARGADLHAYVIDVATGKVTASVPSALDEPGAPVVVGDRVITHASGGKVEVVDVAAGTATPVDTRGRGCASGGDYVTLEDDRLTAWPGGDPSGRRTIAAGFALDRLVTCGRHGDTLIVVAPTNVLITDLAGVVRHTIALDHPFQIDEDAERFGVGPLQGELPRFVPFVSVSPSGDAHLRVLDVEAGAVAWDGPDDPLGQMRTLVRAGADWYLALDGEITRIDGATGEPAATIAASHDDGLDPLRPPAIGGGRLWLTSPFRGPIDQLEAASLDATTLGPAFTRRIRVLELTEEGRAVLGRE